MGLHNGLGDSKTEARSATLSDRGGNSLSENLEYTVLQRFRNAMSMFDDGHAHNIVTSICDEFDLRMSVRKYHGIQQQIVDNLLDPIRVG